jgi:hypothetical protein
MELCEIIEEDDDQKWLGNMFREIGKEVEGPRTPSTLTMKSDDSDSDDDELMPRRMPTIKEEDMGDWELYEEKFPEAKKRFEEVLKKNRKPMTTGNGKITMGIDQSTLNELIRFEAHRRHGEEGIRMRAQHEAEQKAEASDLGIDELDFARAGCSQSDNSPKKMKYNCPLKKRIPTPHPNFSSH